MPRRIFSELGKSLTASATVVNERFVYSDPYVRIDLVTINGDETIDYVLTKTKKKVCSVIV